MFVPTRDDLTVSHQSKLAEITQYSESQTQSKYSN